MALISLDFSSVFTCPSTTRLAQAQALTLWMAALSELMQHKGSLARAVLPLVSHLRWGWHRVERALERGQFLLDGLFDRADEGSGEVVVTVLSTNNVGDSEGLSDLLDQIDEPIEQLSADGS